MQHARAQNILSGQTNLARRVFAAVPMQAFWTAQDISFEMNRLENHNLSKGEILGCLRTLVDAGLVNETASTTFRSNVKSAKESVTVETKKTAAQAKPLTLLERFTAKAEALREMADDLEMLGLEADQAIKDAGKGNAEMMVIKQNLRALLGTGD